MIQEKSGSINRAKPQSMVDVIGNLYELGGTCVVTSGVIVKHETTVQVVNSASNSCGAHMAHGWHRV